MGFVQSKNSVALPGARLIDMGSRMKNSFRVLEPERVFIREELASRKGLLLPWGT